MKRKNTIANNPLLRKGGVHEKSKSAERHRLREELKDEWIRQERRDEYRDEDQ